MLTSKQKELLMLIHARLQETGVPPSFDEMKEALDLKSKSGIHRLITALEERGFIRRLPHRARALEILKMPESSAGPSQSTPPPAGFSEAPQQKLGGFQPSVIEGGGKKSAAAAFANMSNISGGGIGVPLMGRIAAGVPISAIQNHAADITCPPDMLGPGEHFALEVKGDSMIDAGIHEGDIVIIRRQETANNGDIIGRARRKRGSHTKTIAQKRRFRRSGGREPEVRDANLRPGPSRYSRASGGLDP